MNKIEFHASDESTRYLASWLPETSPKYLDLSGCQVVRYIEVGDGPTLVLLHTVRTQLDIFQRVIPKLKSAFRIFALDYPGFGWSRIVPGTTYNEPFLRRHVIQFVDKLGLQDVTLAGESIGATLSLTIAAQLSNRL